MAIEVSDITVDDANDLLLYNDDFKIEPSDNTHVESILRSYLGHWKEYPNLGVGIDFYRSSSGSEGKLKKDILNNLVSDGYSLKEVKVIITPDKPKFYIDAERISNGKI